MRERRPVGEAIGANLGAKLGGFVHKTIGRLFGKGEYKEALASETGVEPHEVSEPNSSPEVNSLVQPVSNQDLIPIMHSGREGTIVIRKREFVRTLNISSTPQVYGWAINPGRVAAFPWLHQAARNFQEFKILGLAAEYVPTSGFAVSSTNAALGQVIFAFQYNVIYQNGVLWPTTSDAGLLNMAGAMSCSPASVGTCYMECADHLRTQNNRFVHTEDPSTIQAHSLQNVDAAWLAIRTSGAQDAIGFQAGQVWVTYEIELSLPRTVDPAFSLSPGPFADAVHLFSSIHRFSGPYSKEQACLVDLELTRLTCLFQTPEFQMWLARQQCRAIMDSEPDAPPQPSAALADYINKSTRAPGTPEEKSDSVFVSSSSVFPEL